MVSSRMSGCGNRAAHAECWLSRRVSEDTRTNYGQATAVAIERVALTKTWVLDKLIENVDRAHRSRWSPRARGEGWWPIIRLLGPQGPLPRKDFNPLQIFSRVHWGRRPRSPAGSGKPRGRLDSDATRKSKQNQCVRCVTLG